MINKAIFFDRDGVINELIARDGGHYSPRKASQFILKKNVKEAVDKAKQHNYICLIVSNQPDISRGKMSEDELALMTKFMLKELDLDDVFYCTQDDDNDFDGCRKPEPGMLLKAQKKWDIDFAYSFFVGDTWRDVEAANRANITPILIDTSYNQEINIEHRVNGALSAVNLILQREKIT